MMQMTFEFPVPVMAPIVAMCLAAMAPGDARAAGQVVAVTSVVNVAVNGGADTTNSGTTCIQLANSPVAACTNQWLAIPNNNKQLLATILLAKSTGATVAVYYDDAQPNLHCPWMAFTPCSITSVLLK